MFRFDMPTSTQLQSPAQAAAATNQSGGLSFENFFSDYDDLIPGWQSDAVYVVESRQDAINRANGITEPKRKMSAALLAGAGLLAGGIIFWAVKGL